MDQVQKSINTNTRVARKDLRTSLSPANLVGIKKSVHIIIMEQKKKGKEEVAQRHTYLTVLKWSIDQISAKKEECKMRGAMRQERPLSLVALPRAISDRKPTF